MHERFAHQDAALTVVTPVLVPKLDALPPDAFTPRIALLDALMRSIEITEPFDLQPSEG